MKFFKGKKLFLLRPGQLSHALALVWVLFVFYFSIVAIISGQSSRLTELFKFIYPLYQPTLSGLPFGLIWAYIYGYILGFLIGYIYSKMIIRIVEEQTELFYEIDFDKPVNLIQKGEGDNPYTIVFVANPLIARGPKPVLGRDPVMDSKVVFYQAVLRCFRSFAANELLRLPEIMTRLRVITIFDDKGLDPKKAANNNFVADNNRNSLCEDVEGIGNAIAPREDTAIVRDYVKRIIGEENDKIEKDDQKIHADPIDLIFVISASEDLTRSAARFTNGEESKGDQNGKEFEFSFSDDLSDFRDVDKRLHAYYTKFPGVVAFWAYEDRTKVPVHEFAHAMSSLENGIIFDEYVDKGHTNSFLDQDTESGSGTALESNLMINKKFREIFQVTDKTIDGLEKEGVPEPVRISLQSLKSKPPIRGRAKFLGLVSPTISTEDFNAYKRLILKHADLEKFRFTEESRKGLITDGVPETLVNEIQTTMIVDTIRLGRLKLFDLLKKGTGIGEDNAKTYFLDVVKHTKHLDEPIPNVFAIYRCNGRTVEYYSDRYRNDKHRSWVSYVPEKENMHSSCTMDITYYRFWYDKLIFDFMYDRLMAKINRPGPKAM